MNTPDKTSNKNILITGSSGLIGTKLIRSLQDKGYFVSVLSRNPEKLKGVKAFKWNIEEQTIDHEALKDVDTIIHLAGAGIAGAVTLFFTWIGWLTLKQEHRDPWLRRIIIAFAGLGGTSFFQANLTATDFTGATLKSSNFNQGHWYRLIGG